MSINFELFGQMLLKYEYCLEKKIMTVSLFFSEFVLCFLMLFFDHWKSLDFLLFVEREHISLHCIIRHSMTIYSEDIVWSDQSKTFTKIVLTESS